MSRISRSFFGLLADQGANFASILLVFVTTPMLIKCLGQADYGFWMTAMQVLGYIGLVDPGFGMQITRVVAGRQDSAGVRSFLATAFYLQLAFAVFFVIIGCVVGLLLERHISKVPESQSIYRATYILAVMVGAVGVISGFFLAVLAGRQRLIATGLIGSLQATVGLAAGSAAVWFGRGLLALPIAYLSIAVVSIVVALFLAHSCESELSLSWTEVSGKRVSGLAGFSFYFQMTKLAFVVLVNTPGLVIASLLGPAAVAVYVVTSRLAQTSGALIARAANVVYPGLAELMAEGNRDALGSVIINIQYNSARLGFFVASIILIGNETFVGLWVGKDLYGGLLLTCAVCGMLIRDSIVRALGSVIYADGNVRGLGWCSLVETFLTLGFVFGGTKLWGVGGAAMGALLATSVLVSPFIICRIAAILQMPVLKLLWLGSGRAILRSIIPTLLLWGVAYALPKALGWWWLICVGLVAAMLNVVAFDLSTLLRTRGYGWSSRLHVLYRAR